MSVVELTSDGPKPIILRDDAGHFFVLNRSSSRIQVRGREVDNHYLGMSACRRTCGSVCGRKTVYRAVSVRCPKVARLLKLIGLSTDVPFHED